MLRRTLAQVSIVLVASLFATTGAEATARRTFVASYGNDANPCSLTFPCRAFAAAVAQTIVGGEVIVLDSAGYGPVTIMQPVSIIAPPGVYAGVSVSSGRGIIVNSGVGTVVLSGLTIAGPNDGYGIYFQSGDALRIERSTVSGTGTGLHVKLSAAATLLIHESAFLANSFGLFVEPSAGVLTVEIEGSHFDQNAITGATCTDNMSGVASGSTFNKNMLGVFAQPTPAGAPCNMTFRNCVLSANSSYGFGTGGTGGATIAQITDSEISDNSNSGVLVQGSATVTLSNTTVTRNGTGLNVLGGAVRSFQDNRVYGNAVDGSFTSTVTKQ